MIVDEFTWTPAGGWLSRPAPAAVLVLYFGARAAMEGGGRFADLRDQYSNARIIGCTTGGQIRAEDVDDDRLTGVAIAFDRTRVKIHSLRIENPADSRRCGGEIGAVLRC